MIKLLTHCRPVGFSAGLFLLILFLFSSCEQQEQEKELRPDTNMGSTVTQNIVQADQILPQLIQLQEKIVQNPKDVELRKEFLAQAFDKNRQVLYTAGAGKFPPEAANSAMARQSAERAAFIDACRWGAYALKWKDNPATPDYGEIKGDLPNARILYKTDSGDGVQTVVEIGLVY